MPVKFNKKSREELVKELKEENKDRVVISFYKYTHIEDVSKVRDYLYERAGELGCMGRIYIAGEGINAQISIPTKNQNDFEKLIDSIKEFADVKFNTAVAGHDQQSFVKLIVREKAKIVADGIKDKTFDSSKTGGYIDAVEMNKIIEEKTATVLDIRNVYESEIGRFQDAKIMKVDTFKEQISNLCNQFSDLKDEKIVLYCTGGIRCEKASAWMKHNGFKHVHHLKQGIIGYAKQVKKLGLENKFLGKNFVFDDRRAEKISDDILSKCHICKKKPCDDYTDCKNHSCDIMFICCEGCMERKRGYCSYVCMAFDAFPRRWKKFLLRNNYKFKGEGLYKRKSLV